MKHDRSVDSPIWPYVSAVVCLFLLSVLATESWRGESARRSFGTRPEKRTAFGDRRAPFARPALRNRDLIVTSVEPAASIEDAFDDTAAEIEVATADPTPIDGPLLTGPVVGAAERV